MTNETNPGTVESKNLSELLAWARNWMDTASPEEKAAMWQAQRESWSKGPHGPTDGMGTVYVAAQSQPAATVQEVDWLKSRVVEVMEDDGGCWRACSGCQESVDGYVSTKDYPRSAIFKCQPGSGCRECGGIGVIYDDGGFLAGYGAALTAEPAAKDGDPVPAEIDNLLSAYRDAKRQGLKLLTFGLWQGGEPADRLAPPSPQPDMGSGAGETLEQYADRIVAATRRKMLDRLDDDVIGHLGDSHLIFGKACAMEAVTTAINEMGEKIAEEKVAALSPPASQSVEKIREALQLAKEALAAGAPSTPIARSLPENRRPRSV